MGGLVWSHGGVHSLTSSLLSFASLWQQYGDGFGTVLEDVEAEVRNNVDCDFTSYRPMTKHQMSTSKLNVPLNGSIMSMGHVSGLNHSL